MDLLIGWAAGSEAGGASKTLFDALKQHLNGSSRDGANAKELAATLHARLLALRQNEFGTIPDNEVKAVEFRLTEFLRLHSADAPYSAGLSPTDLQSRFLAEQRTPWRDVNESLGQRMLEIVCNWLIETAAQQKDFLRKAVQEIIARQRKADERATQNHAETTAQNQKILTEISAVQNDPGLKWARSQAQLALDHTPAATDQAAVEDPLAIALHAAARRAARDLARANPTAGNEAPTDPFWQAVVWLTDAVDRPLRELPNTVTEAWIVTLLLGSELESNGDSMPPARRKLLTDALNFTSTLLSFFPTARQLHARAQAMRPRPDLREPAAAALGASMDADFVPRQDGETVRALLNASPPGQPHADEARVVAEVTIINLALATAQWKTILTHTGQGPGDAETLRRIDAAQRSAETPLRTLAANIPADQRYTILTKLDALKTLPDNPDPTTPPADFSQSAAEAKILAGQRIPASWQPFITRLGFGRIGFDAQGDLQPRNAGFQTRIDLTLLTPLTHLQRLALADMQISDLSPLRGLAGLQTLDLAGTQVSDLSPLRGLAGLQTLWLDHTQVSDLSPLTELPALRLLYLTGAQLSTANHQAFIAERSRRSLPPVSFLGGAALTSRLDHPPQEAAPADFNISNTQ